LGGQQIENIFLPLGVVVSVADEYVVALFERRILNAPSDFEVERIGDICND